MSTDTSDGSENIASQLQNADDKSKKRKIDNNKMSMAVIENVLGLPMKKIKNTEKSASPSTSSNSSDSDTDDSLDLDQEQNERDQRKCEEKLQEIESNFEYLRNSLYEERIREVDNKLEEVKMGSAKEYVEPLKLLKTQLKTRLEVAAQLKKFKLANLEHKFKAEEQAIIQHYKNKAEMLYDTMRNGYQAKIDQLNEARSDVEIDASLWLGRSLTRNGRGRGRHPYGYVEDKHKPVVTTKPTIVYMLKEEEILEDWTAIKKSLLLAKRKERGENP